MGANDETAVTHPPLAGPSDEVARARADYLAVSRCAHLYASADDYDQAESSAWDRLQSALERAGAAVSVSAAA